MTTEPQNPGSLRLSTVLAPVGPATAIELTDDQVDELGGGRRAAVVVNIGDRTARLRLARMGGANLIGLSKAARADLGVEIGDRIDAVIRLDTAERTIDVPDALAAALDDAALRAAFDGLSYTRRKELARGVADAKRPDTVARRIAAALEELGALVPRVVRAERVVAALRSTIFELIADPARQPEWDGNDNLTGADSGQRVHAVGDVFVMRLTKPGAVRENRIVEFEEGRLIAWNPAEVGGAPPGHLWRWELFDEVDGTRVVHTYDWSALSDPKREVRARATTSDRLGASIDRLAALAEGHE